MISCLFLQNLLFTSMLTSVHMKNWSDTGFTLFCVIAETKMNNTMQTKSLFSPSGQSWQQLTNVDMEKQLPPQRNE